MPKLTPTEFYRQQEYQLAYAEHSLYRKLFEWYADECLAVHPPGSMRKPPTLDPAMADIVARARREWVERTGLPALNPHEPETWQTAAIAAVMNGRPGVDVYTQTPKSLANIVEPWAIAKLASTPANHDATDERKPSVLISPKKRTIPMSYRRAAKLMGKGDSQDAAEWLSKSVADGSIPCDHISRQSHVFSREFFPKEAWHLITPK